MKHPRTGANQSRAPNRSVEVIPGFRSRLAKSFRLSLVDGRRGVQERKGLSQLFESFIVVSSQADTQFLDSISVPARCCVGRDLQKFADLFKGVFVPNLQNDDFALIGRQSGQATHGRALGGRLAFRPFKPPCGFGLASQTPPETSAVIERAVPEAAHAIMFRLFRPTATLHQGQERLLHDVLRFPVAKPQSPAIEDQLGRLGFIKPFAPLQFSLILVVHVSAN